MLYFINYIVSLFELPKDASLTYYDIGTDTDA
jgi:hypothetical protein